MFNMLIRWYGRHKVLAWSAIGLFVFYCLAGFVAAPVILGQVLETRVSKALHRGVQVAQVRLNPFTFTVSAAQLSVSERDGGPFLKIGRLFVNLDPLVSLFKWGAVIQSIRITDPHVRIIRNDKGQLNFSDLMVPSPEKTAKNPDPDSKPVRVVIGMFKLEGGQVQFIDNALPSAFKSDLSGLEVTLSDLDTKPAAEAFSYHLRAATEAGEHLIVNGMADLQPLAAQAEVALKKLVPAKYAPYYRPYLNAGVGDGRLDLQASLRWSEQIRSVSDIMVKVTDFILNDGTGQKNLVQLPQLDIEKAAIDFKDHRIQLGKISAKDARVKIQRAADGQMDLLSALAPPGRQASESDSAPTDQGAAATPPAWEILAPVTTMQNGTVDFEDLQPATPFRISLHQIALDARNISTRPQTEGQVELQLKSGERGSFSVQGGISLDPFKATLQVAAEALDIRPLQPYLKPLVQLVVTRGEFSAKGRLELAPRDISPGSPQTNVNFTGQASLSGFEAVDAVKAEPFSKWKSLFLTGIDMTTVPLTVKIDKVALTDFFNRFAVDPDGTSNIETIIGPQREKAETRESTDQIQAATESAKGKAEPSGGPGADIRIKTVTLQGGKVDFSDQHIKPNVHMVMTELGGRISGLDNIKEDKADVFLRGMVNGNTPLEIKGRVNPLIEKPYVDLNLTFPGIDLSPFGPYSGKYLGYTLAKGQLAFTLAYKVVDNKLAGENKIQINQLTFGDAVPSPQATKLPVKLAVSLLKDRQGNIDLDLPVKGDLDDPEFSFGGLILKMFVNLITEIVSAPFKMLGALFGGGPELAYLRFDPGQSVLSPEDLKKLDTMAKILFERPGLNLEIQGQADPQEDAESLRRMQFEKDLKAAKLKALLASGRKAVPLDQIEITPVEHEAMIQKAYQTAPFPKPRDDKGQLKKLSPPEMEKLLYTAIAISPDDLRQLAYRRATAAKEYLLTTGKVEAGRLFVTEPIIESRKEAKNPKAQVQFNLK